MTWHMQQLQILACQGAQNTDTITEEQIKIDERDYHVMPDT